MAPVPSSFPTIAHAFARLCPPLPTPFPTVPHPRTRRPRSRALPPHHCPRLSPRIALSRILVIAFRLSPRPLSRVGSSHAHADGREAMPPSFPVAVGHHPELALT